MRKGNTIVGLMSSLLTMLVLFLAAPLQGAESENKTDELELVKAELEAVAESAAQANQRLTKMEADTAAYKKSNDAKVKQLGIFSFSGDIRLRYEGFFKEGVADRNRERVRLRFNMTGKISDEFSGGFSLATGNFVDPVSTNQSLGDSSNGPFLNRKTIGIDKAFVSYKPTFAKSLKLDAGKFSFPWYRTSMTFDGDLNPEGFAQTLSFDIASSTLKSITIVGFQLPLYEVSGGPDSFMLGGQIQTQFQLGSKTKLGLYGAGINFPRMSQIATHLANSAKYSANTNTNTTQAGVIKSNFAYFDMIMKLDMDTHPRFPTTIVFNFVNNVRGPKERSGYYTEVAVGKQKDAKDLQFGYTLFRIEKDAAIYAFNDSDLREPTNIVNHRLQAAYLFHSKITGQFTLWIGKRLNVATVDTYLKRFQFDLIYKL